jgi:hypothetical protein
MRLDLAFLLGVFVDQLNQLGTNGKCRMIQVLGHVSQGMEAQVELIYEP